MRAVALVVSLLAVVAGCTTRSPTTAAIGHEVTLEVGQKVTLGTELLTLEFVSVTRDSRCPEDVRCPWAGHAEVLLRVQRAGRETQSVALRSGPPPEGAHSAVVLGHRVTLLRLTPSPRSDRSIRPAEYVATIVVNRR